MAMGRKKPETKREPQREPEREPTTPVKGLARAANFGPEFVLESRGEGMTFAACLACGAVVLASEKKLHAETHA